jgi:hypothetical protein
MMIKGKNTLGQSWYTLAMLWHGARAWDDQGNDCFRCTLGIAPALGSNVTSCSNEKSKHNTFLFGCVPRVVRNESAFRELGENATSQIIGATHKRKALVEKDKA